MVEIGDLDEIVFKEIFGLDLESQVVEYGHKKMFLRPRLAGGTHTNKTNKSSHDSHRDAPTPGIITGIYKY